MNKLLRIFLLAAAFVVTFASCERRPLVDPTSSVSIRVQVNIKAIANVTTEIYNERIPVPDLTTNSMRVMIYDPETKGRLGESIISGRTVDSEGNQVLSGNLNISYGSYDLLVYNEFDTPKTKVSDTGNLESIIAYTDDISAETRMRLGLGTKADDDTFHDLSTIEIKEEPDHLVVARENNLYISPHDTVVVIKTIARTIVDSYYIQIHVEGMKYASSASAVISGLSPSNRFGLGLRTVEHSTAVCFPLVKSVDVNLEGENKDVLCAVFNTFGKIEDAASNLYVTFNVIDTAGQIQKKEVSLDEIFKSEDAIKRHWLLVDETWTLQNPDVPPVNNGGGFQPVVDEWEHEEGNITL